MIENRNNLFSATCLCTEYFMDSGKLNFPDGGSVFDLSKFSILPQLPSKIMTDLKVVKIKPKIIISF